MTTKDYKEASVRLNDFHSFIESLDSKQTKFNIWNNVTNAFDQLAKALKHAISIKEFKING